MSSFFFYPTYIIRHLFTKKIYYEKSIQQKIMVEMEKHLELVRGFGILFIFEVVSIGI